MFKNISYYFNILNLLKYINILLIKIKNIIKTHFLFRVIVVIILFFFKNFLILLIRVIK